MRNRVAALAAVVAFAVALTGVAVVAARSGGDGLERLPALAGGGGERADMAAMATAAPQAVEYQVGRALPDLPSEAAAYRLRRGVDRAAVERLARALGITAPVVEEGRRYMAGLLTVEDAPGAPWYLSSAGRGCKDAPTSSDDAASVTVQGCAVATTTSTGCPPDATCRSATMSSSASVAAEPAPMPEPGPPAEPDRAATPPKPTPAPLPHPEPVPTPVPDLPSRAEAERIARDTFAAMGVPVDGLDLQGGFASWDAVVAPRIDGLEVLGMSYSLSIGPKGAIQHAGGYLGTPKRIGDYPLVGVETAFDRLRTGGDIAADGGPRPLVARADGADHTVTITVTGVHLALQHVVDALVPAYVFETDVGGSLPVPAVPDRYLERPSTTGRDEPGRGRPEPVPADTGGSGCAGSAAGGSSAHGGDDNAPMSVEVCVQPAVAKVGQEVVFTVTAKDPDAPITGEGCGGPYATFGDEAHPVTAECMPMCAAQRTKPAKEAGERTVTYRHAYERPGTYTARFAFQSAVCNPYGSRGEASVTVEVR